MYTLGINAAYHDSSACLVRDGVVLAAAEEERFTGVKHGKRPVPFSAYELPFHAVDYCLASQNLNLVDVDHIAYSFDPSLLPGFEVSNPAIKLPLRPSDTTPVLPYGSVWDPLFLSYLVNAPRQLVDGAPHHLKKRFRGSTHQGPFRWHSVPHHIAHAASAFLVSPFREAAVLTLDGRGERATTTYSIGRGNDLELLGCVDMPDSLGLFYEKVTDFLGFLRSSDEYKVMALASFGRPRYRKEFEEIIALADCGRYCVRDIDLTERFGRPRERGGPIETRECDIARSLQDVLEETVLQLVRWLHKRTGLNSLCMAGGVALNCVMNSKLRDQGPFEQIWVQPASGDAGTALGAAVWVDAKERNASSRSWCMDHVYLGPSFSDEEIEVFLQRSKLSYRRMKDVAGEIADLLVQDAVIGWFQGRMEFGPRALGARSILASPLHASMQSRLNEIKDREDFRPVAPVVLEEEAGTWFSGAGVSPFMLFVYNLSPEKAGLIPAVRHVDNTARIQTINRGQHPLYYDLIRAFAQRSGVPVLVNTSFNTRGKPIVCTPRDAVECFFTSPIDALALGSFLLLKQGA